MSLARTVNGIPGPQLSRSCPESAASGKLVYQGRDLTRLPLVNLPELHRSRWGGGLTAADMTKCVWTRPELVAKIEFLEWTESDHLRHSKFAGLREDKDARNVSKERPSESV